MKTYVVTNAVRLLDGYECVQRGHEAQRLGTNLDGAFHRLAKFPANLSELN